MLDSDRPWEYPLADLPFIAVAVRMWHWQGKGRLEGLTRIPAEAKTGEYYAGGGRKGG